VNIAWPGDQLYGPRSGDGECIYISLSIGIMA
jgi:hypothetical protein